MLRNWQFWLLNGLGALTLVLVLTDLLLDSGNRSAQRQVSERAQFIQQSQQLEPIYQGIIKTLADLAAQHQDEPIRELLASQGIRYETVPANANKPAPTSSAGEPGTAPPTPAATPATPNAQ